jgi:hypothetical protein
MAQWCYKCFKACRKFCAERSVKAYNTGKAVVSVIAERCKQCYESFIQFYTDHRPFVILGFACLFVAVIFGGMTIFDDIDDENDYFEKINNSSESDRIIAVVLLSIGILLVVGGTIAALRLEKFKTLAKTYCCLFPCAMTMAVVVVLALGLHIIFFGVLVRRGVLWRSVSSRGLTFFLVLLLHNCF